MRLSIASSETASLTVDTANSPASYPLRRLVKDHGHAGAVRVLAHLLAEADMSCGGDAGQAAFWSGLVLQQFGHRSLEALIVAIRDGMMSGKIYGRLAYPQIAEWLNEHEAKVIGAVENEHMASRFTGDNLGADYMDRLEHDAGAKDRKLTSQSRLIDELRRKLDAKP